MRVVFINPDHGSTNKPPLGLLSLATVCRSEGYEVQIVDDALLHLSDEELLQIVSRFHVVALTAMTPTITEAERIARLIKKALPDKPIILGGVHATIFPQECFVTKLFDIVVVGEGEDKILRALDQIDAPQILSAFSKIQISEKPLPDYSLIDIDAYKPRYPHGQNGKWTSASTSRGCPFHCSFCCKSIHGREWRSLRGAQVVELVTTLAEKHGIQDITFYDDLFTLNSKRVFDICAGLQGMGVSWSCENRVDMADFMMLNRMGLAGCDIIYYGIESGSQVVLDRMNKGIKLQQVRDAVHFTKEAGIKPCGYFMLGSPGETRDTIQETLEFAKSLDLFHAQFSVCSPLPGSKLYQEYLALKLPVPAWSSFRYLGKNGNKPMFPVEGVEVGELEAIVEQANKQFSGVKA